MGDYNINLLNYGKHKETSEFVNLFHSYFFISLINKPTRLAGQNATLIDNGKIFRITSILCGEFTGHRWIPRTKASDEELWCFLWYAPE